MSIIHLIKVLKNNINQLIPEDYKTCPRYNHDQIKLKCVTDKNNKCMGVDNNSIVKNIDKEKFILQCNYWCD